MVSNHSNREVIKVPRSLFSTSHEVNFEHMTHNTPQLTGKA